MSVDSGTGSAKSLLGDRYTVVKELDHSGFGKTYLAEDQQMSGELCVVQELLPKIKDKASVEKAKDLFEQEGRVLFLLANPQVPEFKELIEVPFETDTQSGARLFLAQDYIPGQSYQEIADGRSRTKNRFNETELTQLLQQMLPVLSYIHSRDVIHKDICPENLILDKIEGQPVLINFASVQEIAAKVRSRLKTEGIEDAPIRVGRVGYAPQEQLSAGQTDQTSDLYGLAATIMVLATGENPETLIDSATGNWRGFELFSPKLGRILARMLAVNAGDRYPSAQAVLTALQQEDTASTETATNAATATGGAAVVASVAESMYSQPTGVIDVEGSDILVGEKPVIAMASPGFSPMDTPVDMSRSIDIDDVPETYERELVQETRVIGQPSWREALIALGVMTGFVATALLIASLIRGNDNRIRADRDDPSSLQVTDAGSGSNLRSGEFLPEETARRLDIQTRREQLGINDNFFTNLVNQIFYQEYPVLLTSGTNNGPQPVTDAPADEPLRIRWDHIALDLLQTMERINPRSLSKLGSYSESDRETWRSQVSEVGIETRSLYDLVDAKFFSLFPNQTGEDFLTKPTGQIYYALADSQARAIAEGGIRESVTFDPGEFRQNLPGQLDPGEGRLYTIALQTNQLLRLNLQAPTDSTLMSLYPPNPTDAQPSIFADSEQSTWSGSLAEGDYELVVLNRTNAPLNYELAVSIDSVTSAPIAPPVEEASEDVEEDTADEIPVTEPNEAESDTETEDSLDNGLIFDRLEDSPGLGVDGGDGS